MENNSTQTLKIFKARTILLEQLKEQGYDTTDYDGSNLSEVNSMIETRQLDMLITNPDHDVKSYIKFHLEKNLRINNIQEYIDDLFNLESILSPKDNIIIVIKTEPNDSLIKAVKNIWEQQKIFIILYNLHRLQFNVLHHELVPAHRVLSDTEAEVIKKRYNIQNDDQIPDISRFSPVSLAIGLRPGQLCKITRPSKTSIETDFYRICI